MFVLIYIALGAADLVLMMRYARKDLDEETTRTSQQPPAPAPTATPIPALTY